MKLLFVHGTKIKEDTDKNYYTGGSYSEEVWNRYLAICTEFTIIARKESFIYEVKEAKRRFNDFNKERINFIEVPNLNASLTNFLNNKQRSKKKTLIKSAVMENDFIIARLPSKEGNLAVEFAKKYNKPYLIEVVGCSWDALWNYNFKGKLLAPISFISQKKAVKNAPYAVYVTKEFLQKRYSTRGVNVNCSNVSLENFNSMVLNKRIDKIKSLSSGHKLIIGTIGAVDVSYKGQDAVIKTLGELKKQGFTNFEYQLVGGGNNKYLNSISQKYDVADQIKFLGAIPHSDIFKWLDKIDTYIQPSKTEGLPRSLVEAMSRGLFVMGTKAGGIPELVEEKYLFNKSNIKSELGNVLKNITRDDLLLQAKLNFDKSKEYNNKTIEKRRREFFNKAINDQ